MSAHTPGPWSVPHFAEPDVNCECGYVLTDHLMGAVCTVHASGEGDDYLSHGDNPKFAEACANARLISAAPDYDAAAKAVVAAFEPFLAAMTSDMPLADKVAAAEAMDRAIGMTRAAIARATLQDGGGE